eukprot:6198650-Pleurochrysis_carterae.AAC.1
MAMLRPGVQVYSKLSAIPRPECYRSLAMHSLRYEYVMWDASCFRRFAYATHHASAAVGMLMAQVLFNAAYVIDKCVDAIDGSMADASVD